MTFREFSSYLDRLEKITSRNVMVEILADLFEKEEAFEIDKMMYLLQGRVAPLYVALEFGMADKMVLRAIAKAYEKDEKEVMALFKNIGDLGEVSAKLAENHKTKKDLSVGEVFDTLKKVAEAHGTGSVDIKVDTLANLLKDLDPLSARFVSRMPVGRLRLGFSDMTVLDSLSWMLSKSKIHRPEIEKAYNVRPDLGFIGKIIKEKGSEGLESVKPEVFTPILMARAERMSGGAEIIEKIGKCAIEPKIDGFRLQAHYKRISNFKFQISNKTSKPPLSYSSPSRGEDRGEGENKESIKLYTRNLEDSTFMYPDVVEGIKNQVKADEVILEGEAVAYNPNTGEFLPFQETVQRKRKYDIAEKAVEIPLKFIIFELLYKDGESFINKPYVERRRELEKIIQKDDLLIMSSEKTASTAKEIENAFEDSVSRGLEGIMAKRLEGVYQAGARSWNWIKLKRSYASKLEDTIDAVVMGYNFGRGKRTAFGLGAFLIGIYDKKKDMFVTVSKIGTGLTDEEWKALFNRCLKLKAREKPPLYDVDKMLEPDVWIEPQIIVEIRADEITRSPVHTAGRVLKPSKNGEAFMVDVPGFALRFPRLEHFRDDRKPEDATTLPEIEDMFEAQKKLRVKK